MISELRLGGALISVSVVLLRLLTEFGMAVFVIVLLVVFASSAIPIPRMVQGYHPAVSY